MNNQLISGATSDNYEVSEFGNYKLVIADNSDCIGSREFLFEVRESFPNVGKIPNMVSPNGDGINDTWKIKQPQYFQEAKISIYDRYGKLLKVMTANEGWDGKLDGNILTPSDYWFSISLHEKEVFGHFTLKL